MLGHEDRVAAAGHLLAVLVRLGRGQSLGDEIVRVPPDRGQMTLQNSKGTGGPRAGVSPAAHTAYMCRVVGVKMTRPLERVLRAFLDDPAAPRYGYDLMKAASLKSGTLYPLLARLESQKLVTSAWETPEQAGQRPRKYYKLTGEGAQVGRLGLAHESAARQRAAAPAAPRARAAPGSLG